MSGYPGISPATSNTCIVDYMMRPCTELAQARNSIEECPNNDCGPQIIIDPNGDEHLVPLTRNPENGRLSYKVFNQRYEDDDDIWGKKSKFLDVAGEPQNSTPTQQPNPNCMQNAVPGSPGLARRFSRGHDGPHARGPLGGGIAITLAPLAGTVINVTGGGDGTNIVDVRLANGDVAVYKDLGRVFVGRDDAVGIGVRIGTVSGGGFGGFDGLHLSLVRGYAYDHYRQLTRQAVGGTRNQQAHARSELSRLQPFILYDPLGPESPVNCPGVPIIDVPVRGGIPTTYPRR